MFIYRLNIFLMVDRERNMTKVAEKLNISLPALSVHIKNLEDELGIQLFERHARGVKTCENAKALLKYAKRAVEAAELVKSKALELSGQLKGSITIGINTDPKFLKIMRVNQLISEDMPEISVRFSLTETTKTEALLHGRTIDLGFSYGQLEDDKVLSIPLMDTKVYVIAHKTLKDKLKGSSWEEILNHPWIISQECPFVKPMKEKDPRFDVPKKLISAEDEDIMAELAGSGQGVAIMREDRALEMQKGGHIEIIEDKYVEMPICINVLKSRMEEELIKRALIKVRQTF